MKTATKTSTIPPLRVNEEVRAAAEAALMEGETLSGFVLEAIPFNIQRRTGNYVSADEVLAGLDKTLARSRKAAASK